MIELAAILIALGLLIFLVYRGLSVILLAPLMAMLAASVSGVSLLGLYTQVFMSSAGAFIVSFFPLFLLGAIFGRLMDDSGAARAIALGLVARLGSDRAILAVVLACAILTYGGVSLFVVAFAVYPIAASLFREADIPKRLIPASIGLGAFTFTMTALPGTPAIQNAIPMPHFGTTPFAAPGLGVLAAMVMFGAGQWWLSRRAAKARTAGEGYGRHHDCTPRPDPILREETMREGHDVGGTAGGSPAELPPFGLALLPIGVVIAGNFAFSTVIIPVWDNGFLAEPMFGGVGLPTVLGLWSIIMALSLAIGLLIALNGHRLSSLSTSLDGGANASILPIFNTASLVGFGAVIASLPAFAAISEAVLGLGSGNPLLSLVVAVNVLAGITGSASGGMSIALETLGESYIQMAVRAGIAPEVLHRITAIATGGLDALPHNGAVVTLLAICGLTHREAYADLAVIAVIVPLLALAVALVAASVFGGF